MRILLKSLIVCLTLLWIAACGPTATLLPSPSPTSSSIPTSPPAAEPPTQVPPTATLAPASSPVAADISKLAVSKSPDVQVLQMLDANNGWALSGAGVLRTSDGGTTWHDATPAGISSRPAFGFFLDEATAWVIFSGADPTSGTLYHTADGGVNWTSSQIPFGEGSIQFIDPLHGWALASLGYALSHQAVSIYRTDDAGVTWTQVFTDDPTASNTSDTLPFAGDKSGLTALDLDHAWVAGSEPVSDFIYLYTTQDGGKTWSSQNPPLPAGFAGAMTNANPPYFFNANEGVLPVGIYANTSAMVLYVTQNGGKNWSAAAPAPINGHVSLASPADFFVWDGGPSLYSSQDAGKTWSTVQTNVNFPNELVSFQFIDPSTGWAVTGDANSHYGLYQTTDGGAVWNALIP